MEGRLVLAGEKCQGVRRGLVVLKASPRSHRMWVVLSSTEEGRDSIDE